MIHKKFTKGFTRTPNLASQELPAVRSTMPKLVSGFTLIELLVVIAIIGILSSIVLASLNSARDKGANAAIKADFQSIRSQAEVVYNDAIPLSYAGICANTNIVNAGANAATAGAGTFVCNNSATAWAASTELKVTEGTSNYWCADSTGVAKGVVAALGVATVCS